MSRALPLSLMICLLIPFASGCQTTQRAQTGTTHSATFMTPDGASRPAALVSTDAGDRELRFASNRKPSSSSNTATFSRLLTGGSDRIPLPEANSGELKQIDPPRQAAANSIGAF